MSTLAALLAVTLAQAPPVLPPEVQQAVALAVRARVGDDAAVVASAVTPVPWTESRPIVDAELAPAPSTRGPVRVFVRAAVDGPGGPQVQRIATLDLTLQIELTHWHTTRAITRGAVIAAGDMRRVRHVLAPGALQRPPSEDVLLGARVARDLAADTCLLAPMVLPAPAIRAGDDVTAWLRVPGVEVRTRMIAVDAGRVGGFVRVRPLDGKTAIRARVIGRAEVEIADAR